MKFWLPLSINVQGQYVQVGTLGLDSSLEKSNRKFACPLESVSFSSSINGPSLVWEIQEGINTEPYVVGFFRQNDSTGHGFFKQNSFNSCPGEINSFGVPEDVDTRVNISICNSSMTIRPTSLNVSSDCDPLKLTCKVSGQEAETNVIYKIASELLSNGNRIFT